MEITKKRKVIEKVIVGYICDCCKNKFTDTIDKQEMLIYRNTGGYSSIFGDGMIITIDLCQNCINDRLGDIIKVRGYNDI